MVNILCPNCAEWIYKKAPFNPSSIIEENDEFVIYKWNCYHCNTSFESKWEKENEIKNKSETQNNLRADIVFLWEMEDNKKILQERRQLEIQSNQILIYITEDEIPNLIKNLNEMLEEQRQWEIENNGQKQKE